MCNIHIRTSAIGMQDFDPIGIESSLKSPLSRDLECFVSNHQDRKELVLMDLEQDRYA